MFTKTLTSYNKYRSFKRKYSGVSKNVKLGDKSDTEMVETCHSRHEPSWHMSLMTPLTFSLWPLSPEQGKWYSRHRSFKRIKLSARLFTLINRNCSNKYVEFIFFTFTSNILHNSLQLWIEFQVFFTGLRSKVKCSVLIRWTRSKIY